LYPKLYYGILAAFLCFPLHAQLVPDAKQAQAPLRAPRTPGGSGIFYHGGAVIADGINLYYIWYGDWSAQAESTAILTIFAQSIGGSPYFDINTGYHGMANGRDAPVQNVVRFAGSTADSYSQGQNLSSDATPAIVRNAIQGGKLPADPNGVYIVLASPDVMESGFCKTSCGWHGYSTVANGVEVKFAFVGNPASQCISFCSLFGPNFPPPNGNPGADAMTSIIAHELSEITNDPHMDAWFDLKGGESADKCQWNYGAISRIPVGQANSYGVYNVVLGGHYFLIQQNWVNSGPGSCGMSY
jgi:hypothetical protein